MFSFEYFFGFIILGIVLRLFLGPIASCLVIILVTIGWSFVFGPWAIATFIELIIGWGAVQAAAVSKVKEDAIYNSKESGYTRTQGGQSFHERMFDFIEENSLYADYLSEEFEDKNTNVNDFGSGTEAKIDYSANNVVKLLVLSGFMDYADSQGGELYLSCDEFIQAYESRKQNLLFSIQSMNQDEKLEFIEDAHERLV